MRRLRSVLSMLKTRSRQVQECSAPAAGAQGNGGAQRTMPGEVNSHDWLPLACAQLWIATFPTNSAVCFAMQLPKKVGTERHGGGIDGTSIRFIRDNAVPDA
jgi:hypothetical protein